MGRTQSASFWSKYNSRWTQTGSLVCVGLDTQIPLIPSFLHSSPNPIWEFNRSIIDSTAEYACAYKPNLAFYLADGLRGLEALEKTIDYIPAEIPVILDCKAGDIGNTMAAYVEGFFESLGVDAITFNPLMGSDVAKPILANEQYYGFALALTSNPSAQDYLKQDNLCGKIALWINSCPNQQIGAVVGATQTADLATMRSLMPQTIFLVPGIGAQGGDLSAVLKHASASVDNPLILINSSRGILYQDNSISFAKAAATEAQRLRDEILSEIRG